MKGRLFMIFIFVLLFIGTVLIFGSAINNNSAQISSKTKDNQSVLLHQEGGVFARSALADEYTTMPEGNRSMDKYYENRAYPGAPPMITHPLISDKGIGGKACLQCHQNGGYVAQFKAYAPVTPHPDWINCRQCHVSKESGSIFKNTDWEKPKPPKLGIQALSTSPIVMPHEIENRENCLSCHAGPGAPKEIRVTHPERINCRQCHVSPKNHEQFSTPLNTRNFSIINNTEIDQKGKKIEEPQKEEIQKWKEEKESN